ncbi:MAG: O-methyltransferase [Candidatus Nanopelagicales bacterium]|jgi:predicted O-methyltransferase YrrM|nr:O-methyltransferase [Candidatus Nanopelagicales bacterium]MDP4746689.1 O-methyltransferase [Candidatus Nanopelagicales bacterium]
MTQMPSNNDWNLSQSYINEDSHLLNAREKSKELGLITIGPGAGALIRFLASTIDASNVVEIGTGTGVSGLCLFRGMNSAGVLTSIDSDPERQRAAREIFSEAGITANKIRLIAGRAIEVVDKLTDNAYDLMFINGEKLEYETLFEQSLRLLRPGGILIFNNILGEFSTSDAQAISAVSDKIKDDSRLISVMIPSGSGIIAASYRPS